MAPLIPRPPAPPDKDPVPLRLERDVARELREYAEFLHSSKEYVVAAALRRVFRHDKEFLAWQQRRRTSAAITPDTVDAGAVTPNTDAAEPDGSATLFGARRAGARGRR